ncbi:MAG: tRNA uracil 4-sulfurtransferase ThiI [Moraxella sp.]|nr:tRNA uracil 4-sulfurtransferase ThiI [Moraxella sp.]
MKFIIKLHPEIIMKSQSVRKRFIKVLSGNIRHVLKPTDETLTVFQHWDFIEVRSRDDTKRDVILDNLQRLSGIHHVLDVLQMDFDDLSDILNKVSAVVADDLAGKSFCVRVKRRGKHDFSSMDVARYVGGGLNQAIPTATVKLKNPDVTVHIEIDDDKMMIVQGRYEGMGGFPMSTQDDVLSLISGGFDSAVASHAFIRRGSRVHYVFFNLGGVAHETGVRQMVSHLWGRYSRSHRVKFISVDFAPVVEAILTHVPDGYMGVVLKRMMVRVASDIARHYKIPALVTGEAMGQVSSQTLTNLAMIDQASDTLILRPLITHDKADIIQMAERIGAYDIAKDLPEYCGVISKKPTVKATPDGVLDAEREFDFAILQKVAKSAVVIDVRQLDKLDTPSHDILTVHDVKDGEMVIDIRSPMETDERPLDLPHLAIPFFKLAKQTADLDKSKTYLLYCQQGVMSRLQAVAMAEQGFDVKVLKLH